MNEEQLIAEAIRRGYENCTARSAIDGKERQTGTKFEVDKGGDISAWVPPDYDSKFCICCNGKWGEITVPNPHHKQETEFLIYN